MITVSGQLRHGVRPGLDLCEDRVVRVGLDRDPVPAERHVVQLAVRVVAPDRCGERVVRRVMCRCARVGRCHAGCRQKGGCGDNVVRAKRLFISFCQFQIRISDFPYLFRIKTVHDALAFHEETRDLFCKGILKSGGYLACGIVLGLYTGLSRLIHQLTFFPCEKIHKNVLHDPDCTHMVLGFDPGFHKHGIQREIQGIITSGNFFSRVMQRNAWLPSRQRIS